MDSTIKPELLQKLKNEDFRNDLIYKIYINNDGLIINDSSINEDIMDIIHPFIEDNIICYDSDEGEEIDWERLWVDFDDEYK